MADRSLIPIQFSTSELVHVTEEEAKLIWLQADSPHTHMLIKTLWYTGLRISEAIAITPNDIHRDGLEFWLLVHRKKQRVRKKTQSATPDAMPLRRDLALDLLDYIKTQGIRPNARLFPAHRSTYWRHVQKCAMKAGIPHWKAIGHPHAFRHGFIYDKRRKGVPVEYLQALAGHSDMKTTLRYSVPEAADLQKVVNL